MLSSRVLNYMFFQPRSLPDILDKARAGLTDSRNSLKKLPEAIPENPEDRIRVLYHLVSKFVADLSELFELNTAVAEPLADVFRENPGPESAAGRAAEGDPASARMSYDN